jgi:hypothetical protein
MPYSVYQNIEKAYAALPRYNKRKEARLSQEERSRRSTVEMRYLDVQFAKKGMLDDTTPARVLRFPELFGEEALAFARVQLEELKDIAKAQGL